MLRMMLFLQESLLDVINIQYLYIALQGNFFICINYAVKNNFKLELI